VLALSFAFDGPALVKNLPSFARLADFGEAPSAAAVLLVVASALLVLPLLWLWKTFLKRTFFSKLAREWAGLVEGTAKFDKFVEQAWLACHYALVCTLEFYVLVRFLIAF